jgi:hypothetical protein
LKKTELTELLPEMITEILILTYSFDSTDTINTYSFDSTAHLIQAKENKEKNPTKIEQR